MGFFKEFLRPTNPGDISWLYDTPWHNLIQLGFSKINDVTPVPPPPLSLFVTNGPYQRQSQSQRIPRSRLWAADLTAGIETMAQHRGSMDSFHLPSLLDGMVEDEIQLLLLL